MVVQPGIIWAEPGIIWWSKPVLVFSLSQAEQHMIIYTETILSDLDFVAIREAHNANTAGTGTGESGEEGGTGTATSSLVYGRVQNAVNYRSGILHVDLT